MLGLAFLCGPGSPPNGCDGQRTWRWGSADKSHHWPEAPSWLGRNGKSPTPVHTGGEVSRASEASLVPVLPQVTTFIEKSSSA